MDRDGPRSKSDSKFEREQERRNPHRQEERDRNAAEVAARLRTRGVRLSGRESSDDLATLLSAVEEFETVVESKGGDIMVHSPGSSQPERRDFLLPARHDGESMVAYIERVRNAAARVERRFH